MPCMCGDICCPSCGPAQGNTRCPICRSWSSDGCEHFDEETGKLKPEFEKQAQEIVEQENKIWEQYYKEDRDHDDFVSDLQEEPDDKYND